MDSRVRDTIDNLERFIADRDDANALPRAAAAFLHGLVLATGARRGVEIGTGYGYSALWIASALANNGGTLVTIDRDAAKTAAARERVAAAGLSDVVECKTGVATDVLNSLPGPFDLVLSDADKENCIDYVKRLLPKLADRAVFVTDNTTTHQEQLAGFVAWNRGHDAFYSVGVPVGNGMELSIKCSASDAVST